MSAITHNQSHDPTDLLRGLNHRLETHYLNDHEISVLSSLGTCLPVLGKDAQMVFHRCVQRVANEEANRVFTPLGQATAKNVITNNIQNVTTYLRIRNIFCAIANNAGRPGEQINITDDHKDINSLAAEIVIKNPRIFLNLKEQDSQILKSLLEANPDLYPKMVDYIFSQLDTTKNFNASQNLEDRFKQLTSIATSIKGCKDRVDKKLYENTCAIQEKFTFQAPYQQKVEIANSYKQVAEIAIDRGILAKKDDILLPAHSYQGLDARLAMKTIQDCKEIKTANELIELVKHLNTLNRNKSTHKGSIEKFIQLCLAALEAGRIDEKALNEIPKPDEDYIESWDVCDLDQRSMGRESQRITINQPNIWRDNKFGEKIHEVLTKRHVDAFKERFKSDFLQAMKDLPAKYRMHSDIYQITKEKLTAHTSDAIKEFYKETLLLSKGSSSFLSLDALNNHFKESELGKKLVLDLAEDLATISPQLLRDRKYLDKDRIISVIKKNPDALEFVSFSDPTVQKTAVLAAVTLKGSAIQYAEKFRNNLEVVDAAIKQDPSSKKYAPLSSRIALFINKKSALFVTKIDAVFSGAISFFSTKESLSAEDTTPHSHRDRF